MEIKHYVRIYFPGVFVAESEVKEIKSRDIKEVKIPKESVGLALYDKIFDEVSYNGKKVQLESKNLDEIYYSIGKVMTLEDVASEYGENSVAFNNIKNNGYKHAIKTSNGSLTFLDEVDVDFVIDPDTLEDDKELV